MKTRQNYLQMSSVISSCTKISKEVVQQWNVVKKSEATKFFREAALPPFLPYELITHLAIKMDAHTQK